jgi:SAM-dependent methyltransferase
VGVDKSTVERDLAGVSHETPAEIRGKDGKTYPATRPPIGPAEERGEFAAGEFDAILDELNDAYGADLTDEIIDRAIEDNLDSKRTPEPTKPDLGGGVSHPARYSDSLMPIFVEELAGFWNVLDPFAGTGRIHELESHGYDTTGVELEEPWAALHERTIHGTALNLTFKDASFDAICTSPTYGNRMADHHNAQDGSYRRTYAHDLGRDLTEGNSGAMQWGPEYRAFHRLAWQEAVRVLRPGGRFVLNIKDHMRARELQLVSHWHVATLAELGLSYFTGRAVPTPSLRYGANADLRMDHEYVFVMDKPKGDLP